MILVKNVVDISKSGGFHITKFISVTGNCYLFLKIKEEMVSRMQI